MCGDAARRTKGLAFFKSLAYLRNGAAYLKTRTERLDAFCAEGIELFAPQRDQLVFFFHVRIANVKRRQKMNSQNAALSVEALNIEAERESAKRLFNALTVQRVNRSTNILVCQQNTKNEIVCPARPGVRSWRHYPNDC